MAISRSAIVVTLGLALAPVAGFALLNAGKAEAVEDTYIRAFFAGDDSLGSRGWCDGMAMANWTVLSSFVGSWLDLDAAQRTRLGALLDAASSALGRADSLCPDKLHALDSLPLPERLDALRRQLGEADMLVTAIDTPLRDFYQSLNEKQRRLLDEQRSRHAGRRGWRTRAIE